MPKVSLLCACTYSCTCTCVLSERTNPVPYEIIIVSVKIYNSSESFVEEHFVCRFVSGPSTAWRLVADLHTRQRVADGSQHGWGWGERGRGGGGRCTTVKPLAPDMSMSADRQQEIVISKTVLEDGV